MRPYRHRQSWGTSGRRPKRSEANSKKSRYIGNLKRSPEHTAVQPRIGPSLAPSAPSVASHGLSGQGHRLSCWASTARTQASIRRALQPSTRPTSCCFTVSPTCRIMTRVRRAADLDHNGLRRGAANGSRPDVPTLDREGHRRRFQGPMG